LIITAAWAGSVSFTLSASPGRTVTRLSSSGRELSRDGSTARMPGEGSSAKISAGVHPASDVVIRPVPAPPSRMLGFTRSGAGGGWRGFRHVPTLMEQVVKRDADEVGHG
jgi:hypothetical protein